MKLIIQIPCYNEAQTLEIALNEPPSQPDGVVSVKNVWLHYNFENSDYLFFLYMWELPEI